MYLTSQSNGSSDGDSGLKLVSFLPFASGNSFYLKKAIKESLFEYIYIYICECVCVCVCVCAFNKFPDFFVQAFKIVVDSWKSDEITDQFLWFQVQMNSYSRNSNTPY